ncbi:long-chain fatty acid transport protein [Sulfuritortus calidifontis]|uniref:Long-chain fatty acid transport protein n=1 Tax=Sulfuritortus calidifontis TaxID=1914471 RepID=A0A4R3JWS5_9PROT|nr:outer membrane protein transport protein [Sulfuritortus calidifontis]TCS72723.1 long-chain fatty acid transport protein [Sulfuritortus calidifontis]
MQLKKLAFALAAAGLTVSGAALATNGMNMEGYGPVATGMGGASFAYDNGTAAMMNNPATLALAGDGSRFDFALGALGPQVESANSLGSVDSDGTLYLMPAFGYTKKSGNMAYGVGMFAQGGMGAEYKAGSMMDITAHTTSFGGTATTGGQKQRSELGVGRVLFPLAYNVNDKLSVGGSVDFVWGGLDILWSQDTENFFGSVDVNKVSAATVATLGAFNLTPRNRRGSVSGNLIDNFFAGFAGGNFSDFHWGTFAFSNASKGDQQTLGYGGAAKLGMTYKVNDKLTIGATYHSETKMSDFEGDAVMSFKVSGVACGGGDCVIPVESKVKVKDFQWPSTYGLGLSYQASDRLQVAADYKRINWSDVMKNFHMVFTANATQSNAAAAGFANNVLDYVYFQNWDDQNVYNIGVAYKYSDKLTLRAGYNYASNPVPNSTVSFLFPATIEQHATVGFGYAFSKASNLDFSFTYGWGDKVTESVVEALDGAGAAGATDSRPVTIDHKQTNAQIMYSYKF